jgi:ABC-type polysaccharide/polyol phosphate export permease
MTAVRSLVRVARYHECMSMLVARALRVRYRRSLLGFAWTLVYPLLAMLVLTTVFSHVFTSVPRYPLFVIVGVLAWGFFSLSCLQAMDALLAGAAVLRKVQVPSAVFPFSAVGANFVNYVLALSVLVVATATIGVLPGLHVLWILTGLLSLVSFTLGIALALAALNLFFHDVRYFFEALLLLWFYATPIVYPLDALPPHVAAFVALNPFHWFLEVLRAALWSGTSPGVFACLAAPALGLAVFGLGWTVFSRLERRFYLYL